MEVPPEAVPRSFERIGHLVKLNLRAHQLPYKHAIGELILSLHKSVRTVLNKTADISDPFRTSPLELLAGVADYETVARENGCAFALDFRRVYWNSRLSTEHQRLTDCVPTGALVLDATCGVGPFAVPLMKKGCFVYCTDTNAAALVFLRKNLALNKVLDPRRRSAYVAALAARFGVTNEEEFVAEFVHNVSFQSVFAGQHVPGLRADRAGPVHVVMNAPGLADQFLESVACSSFVHSCKERFVFHCYFFHRTTRGEENGPRFSDRARALAGLNIDVAALKKVRAVSDFKYYYRADFKLV